jgi:hypothetical protein
MVEKKALVWIDYWEMECCGEPFSVGDIVTWPAAEVVDQSWYADLGLGKVPGWAYSAHTDDEGEIRGAVEEIEAVFCRFRLVRREAKRIPGTGILEHRSHAINFEPHDDWGGPKSWIGYLVRLSTDRAASSRID